MALPKRSARVAAAVVVLAGAQVLACGDDAPAAEPEPISLAQAIEQVRLLACQAWVRCEATWGPVFDDGVACVEMGPWWAPVDLDASRFERVQLYAGDVEACAGALLASCEVPFDRAAVIACIEDSAIGQLGAGDCCDDRGGCGPGLACARGAGGTGWCAVPATVGDACDVIPCADDLLCSSDQRCRTPGGEGDPCGETGDCALGWFCDAASGLCVAPRGSGGPCTTSTQCVAGAYCSLATGTCVSYGDHGAPCDPTQPCALDLYCDVLTSTCAPLPAESESCATLGRCTPDAYCDSALVCQPLPGAFESCFDSGACAGELDCDLEESAVCRPDELPGRVIGEACELDDQCPLGADCVDDGSARRCVAHGLAGSACNTEHRVAADCAEGRGLRCEGEICVAAPVAGDPCTSGELCAQAITTVCDGSTCRRRALIGEACEGAADGPYAWCRPDAVCDLALGVCVPRPTTYSGGPRCPGE